MKNIILTIALLSNLNSNAFNNDYCNTYNRTINTRIENLDLERIFFTNETEDLVFIDFQSISFHIFEVKITSNGKEVIVENVSELNQDMIYEVDLTILNQGEYFIEILIEDNTVIRKPIQVK